MNDDELKQRVLDLILNRFRKFYDNFVDGRSSFASEWKRVMELAGLEERPYDWEYPEEDTDDLFVRHVSLGVIRVPRDAALKILVLGELP